MKRTIQATIEPRVLYGHEEVSLAFGISEKTLSEMIDEGLRYYKVGRIRMFFPEDIVQHIRDHYKAEPVKVSIKRGRSKERSSFCSNI